MASSRGGDQGSKPTKRVGRPSQISTRAILKVARGLSVAELTFPRIAEGLGVSTQALYKYFPNIDALRAALAEDIVREVDFLDDQPLGDFEAYVVRFLLDYRLWLVELNLDPSVFEIEYGATRFSHGAPPEQLYVRLEDFLESAAKEGVPLDAAVRVWFVITDFMRVSKSVLLPDDFHEGFRAELAQGLETLGDSEFPLIEDYLAQGQEGRVGSSDYYEITVRSLVRGLMLELDLIGTSGS